MTDKSVAGESILFEFSMSEAFVNKSVMKILIVGILFIGFLFNEKELSFRIVFVAEGFVRVSERSNVVLLLLYVTEYSLSEKRMN
jgi:hypothetical protein